MNVTLRQLRAFVAVLESESFSDAAKTMRVSQASLSGLIKELEQRVGVRLLDRDTRNVAASVVGFAFEPMVRRVLADLDDALANLTNIKALRRGLVRIAAPEPLSCTILPEFIAKYEQVYPGIEVRFDDIPIDQLRAALDNGTIDAGFAPIGSIVNDALQAQQLYRDPLWIALRKEDPLVRSRRITWKQLREKKLISFMPNISQNVLSNVPPHHHPREVFAVNRINTALSMLRVQDAAVVCPKTAGSIVEGFGLNFMPLTSPTVDRRIAVFARTSRLESPTVKSFVDFATVYLRM